MLEMAKTDKWPYSSRLTLTVDVSGKESYIKRVDLDNLLKLLLDTLKGRVFVDDKQIFSIMASKNIIEPFVNEAGEVSELHGFLVGLRSLKDNERNLCIPPLFSETPEYKIGKDLKTTVWKSVEEK